MSLQILKSFPLSVVKSTSTFYNKAFHAKLFTLFASSESEVYAFAKKHSPHYDFCFAFIKNDESQWYLDIDGIQRVRDWVIQECRKSTDNISVLYNNWKKEWKKYLNLANMLDKTNLQGLSDNELYTKFEEFYSQYLLVGSAAYIADSFMSTGTEDWLESLLSEELSRLGIKHTEKINLLRKLTSPVHLSFTLEAEHQLLIIADKLVNKFQNKLPTLTILKDKHSSLYKELKRLETNFHWIQNNYYNVHYVSADEFYMQILEIIKEAKENNTAIKAILKEKEKELEAIRREKEELTSSLGFSPFIKNILKTARLFSKWKDIRKSGVYMGMYYFDVFLEEISKRTDYTKKELTFNVFYEIKDILLNKKDMHKEIAKREDKCFFAVTSKGYYVVSDKNADTYFKFNVAEKYINLVELRGVCASPGYARGRVRIIRRTEDMKNFKIGEILVANQTTPEFVPIMKKAAAIITEQGGITSHAAVIARELKKPCIIGTKIAASALQDGETVEVDANKGIIIRGR